MIRSQRLKPVHRQGITYGIRYDEIDRMVAGECPRMHVLVASGFMPVDGTDGYYEYFFRTQVARTPKTMDDGYVDYRNVEWFEQVKKGQKLACYHAATGGVNGMTVTGKEIPARRGREQSILTGTGFRRLEDEKRKAIAVSAVVETKLYEGVTFEIERVRWTNKRVLGSVRVKKSENKSELLSSAVIIRSRRRRNALNLVFLISCIGPSIIVW